MHLMVNFVHAALPVNEPDPPRFLPGNFFITLPHPPEKFQPLRCGGTAGGAAAFAAPLCYTSMTLVA